MKKYSSLVLAGLLAVSLTGCDDLLDLEPQASISDDAALTTASNVQTALVGAYAALGGGNNYGGSYIYLTEVYAAPANEIFWNGTFIDPGQIYNKDIVVTNAFVTSFWTGSYNTINRANNVLSALDVFTDATERAQIEAEAKFIRGVAYYNLVMLFGKAYNDGNPATNPGVPLILTPTRAADASLSVPRASVADVYTQVLLDLNAAKAGLPESNGFYADTYVASGFLARVHLTMGNYASAATEADRVIASGNYDLEADIADNFGRTSNGSETIYATQVTPTSGANNNAVYFTRLPYGRADIRIEAGHVAQYEVGDARAALFVNSSGGRGRMTTKYDVTDGSDPRNTNVGVMRLAEMHLIRAEANVRTGGSVGDTPLNDINAIRARVGLAALPAVDLAAVLKERKLELAFEGHLFNDLKRNQGTTSSGTNANIAWNADVLVFPIPDRECKVNATLTQNAGYGVGDCAP